MKFNIRSAAALFALISVMLTSITLFGCNYSGESAPETTLSPETTAPEITETEKETEKKDNKVTNMTINGNELSKYKIVFYDSNYARTCARDVQDAFKLYTGNYLSIKNDSVEESEFEILIGKTNRKESKDVRAAYDRPNVYFDIKVVGNKVIIMGEGYTVLNKAVKLFIEEIYSKTTDAPDINGTIASGNIKSEIDTLNYSVVERAEGTDLRVFHWNMAAPYLNDEYKVYTSNKTRGEIMGDIILQMFPDVITTNEFYASHNGNTELYDAVMKELSDYYVCLDSPYEKNKPIDGADAISGKTINSNIIYRKDIGLSVVSSSWRYSTEKTTVTAENPNGYVYYHGSHTAVFSLNGKKFIVSVSHYADSRSDNKWAKEHLEAINDAQKANGGNLPVILTGDLYTSYASSSANSGYKYIVGQGYIDAQRNAKVNSNRDLTHGTFHQIGLRQTSRISEDFIFYTNQMEALAFKVLTSKDIDDTSDHYPVMADIDFK